MNEDQVPSEPTTTRPRPTGIVRATPVIATIGVLVALVGFALLLRPVETPVQDCGTAVGFLLDGRVNVFADPSAPPDGLSEAEVLDNNERPCRVRAADAARPALLLVIAGTVSAVGAVVAELVVRGLRWRRRHRALVAAAPHQPSADPASVTSRSDA
jgi:hypothetical protein